MVVWRIIFLEIPDLERVVMGWVFGMEGGGSREEEEELGSGMWELGCIDGLIGCTGWMG